MYGDLLRSSGVEWTTQTVVSTPDIGDNRKFMYSGRMDTNTRLVKIFWSRNNKENFIIKDLKH